MSNYNYLKTTINANIKQNGNQEITGPILNSVLNQMVNILGTGYQFAGVATLDPATDPGTPDAKVFYIANGKGTYTNFGGIEVTEDDVVVLYWDSAWHKLATGIASQAKLSELGKEIATKQDIIPDLDSIRSGAALGASALQKETDPNVPSWAKASTKPSYTPAEIGAASEESLQIHENDNIRHITASERTKWNEKQDVLTLTVKDNGNIVIGNIQGQTKEFMPATPSGDPMHYAYEAAGAEWNGTGADIVKTAPWADLADDDADKTVVHKAGYWYLNGLGDITNEQMRRIYMITASNQNYWENYCNGQDLRTNILTIDEKSDVAMNLIKVEGGFRRSTIEVIRIPTNSEPYTNNKFAVPLFNLIYIPKLKFVIGIFMSPSRIIAFNYIFNLKGIKIAYLSISIGFPQASNLSVKSVLYMIENEAATSAITITLHADAYSRAMANADIVAALEAHPNVSLASA